MNPKQLKKLKKQVKKAHQVVKKQPYIEQLMTYRDLFDDFPQIKFLINNVLESDRLIKNGLLPQPLPKLLLPDNIQDIIFKKVNEQYPQGNPEGDRLWNRYVDALPKLDRLLRNYRDYLEATYGMWSYVSAPYIKALSEYLHGRPTNRSSHVSRFAYQTIIPCHSVLPGGFLLFLPEMLILYIINYKLAVECGRVCVL